MQFVFAIITLVASFALQMILTPRPTAPEAAAFEDFDFPQADEGTSASVVFGDVWIDDWIVLWYGNYSTTDVKSDGSKK